MFDAMLKDRSTSFHLAPGTSMFIHWLVGMVYVFYFASFILLLREVLRPGVLWFLRNLNDPEFNPIQEVYVTVKIWAPAWQNQQNDLCAQRKTRISLDIRPVWSESMLCTQWTAKDPMLLHADSEDSDQTGQMLRLIWVFAGHTGHFVGFVMLWFICLFVKQYLLQSWVWWKVKKYDCMLLTAKEKMCLKFKWKDTQ